jgi:glycosyltransferase involved in cell wall biosynthesis
MKAVCDVSVVILTLNEEANLRHTLDSVCGWAKRVFVFDSFSTDLTVEIARERGCEVMQHRFENFSRQRNAALERLPIDTEWVFFLDADEWLPEDFKDEIVRVIASHPVQNGFFCKRKLLWMGAWIRRGYYPTWILRLFRLGKSKCEDRTVNEHLILEGEAGFLKTDFVHEDRNGVGRWIEKHNDYATREAEELLAGPRQNGVRADLFGTQSERVRWIRERAWSRLPPLARPLAYFGYRYVLRGGFLDGGRAFTYHVLHGLWFPFLIDLKYIEMKEGLREAAASAARRSHDAQEPRSRADSKYNEATSVRETTSSL